MIERSRRLPLRTKLAFSSGALEEAVVGAASFATMLFYNQVLGLSASLCGVVFLVAPVAFGFAGVDRLYYWANGAAVLTVVSLHRPDPAAGPAAAA